MPHHFCICVLSRERPLDASLLRVAAQLPSIDFSDTRGLVWQAPVKALAIKARAHTVDDPEERRKAIRLLLEKRPALKRLEDPDEIGSLVIVAVPEEIRLLDYSVGYGHSLMFKLDPDGRTVDVAEHQPDWGYGNLFKPVD